MDSTDYASHLRFWIANTFVIIVTVFIVITVMPTPTDKGIFVTYVWLTLELAFVSGSCVGLLQSFLMPHFSFQAKVRWFGITVASIAIGWCIVFIRGYLLISQSQASLINMSDQVLPAFLDGFLNGALMGAMIGLVTGLIQGYVQPISARQWLMGNLISWSIGIAVPLAVTFAGLSQIRLF